MDPAAGSSAPGTEAPNASQTQSLDPGTHCRVHRIRLVRPKSLPPLSTDHDAAEEDYAETAKQMRQKHSFDSEDVENDEETLGSVDRSTETGTPFCPMCLGSQIARAPSLPPIHRSDTEFFETAASNMELQEHVSPRELDYQLHSLAPIPEASATPSSLTNPALGGPTSSSTSTTTAGADSNTMQSPVRKPRTRPPLSVLLPDPSSASILPRSLSSDHYSQHSSSSVRRQQFVQQPMYSSGIDILTGSAAASAAAGDDSKDPPNTAESRPPPPSTHSWLPTVTDRSLLLSGKEKRGSMQPQGSEECNTDHSTSRADPPSPSSSSSTNEPAFPHVDALQTPMARATSQHTPMQTVRADRPLGTIPALHIPESAARMREAAAFGMEAEEYDAPKPHHHKEVDLDTFGVSKQPRSGQDDASPPIKFSPRKRAVSDSAHGGGASFTKPLVTVVGEGVGQPKKVMELNELACLLQTKQSNPIWVDVEGIPSQVVQVIGDTLSLHSLTVEDCTHFDMAGFSRVNSALEREKIEIFKKHNYCFIQYHALEEEEYSLEEPVPVKLLVFENLLLTLHQYPVPALEQLVDKMKGQVGNIAWLVYDLLKVITSRYFLVVEQILSEIDNLDHLVDSLSRGEQSDFLRRVRLSTRSMVRLQLTLSSKRRVVNSMSQAEGASKYFPNVHYLHDLFDHLSVMLQRLEFSEQLLESVKDAFVQQSSLEMALVSNEISQFMRRLTLVATLIMPLTLISGLWGMNVRLPGMIDTEQDDGTMGPFFAIIGTCLTVIIGGLIYFRVRNMW